MHCANISPQCCINFVSPLLMNGYMTTVQSLSQHAFWHVTQALLIFSFNKLGTTCYCFVSKWLLCKKPTETVTPTQHHPSPTFHYLHLSWVFFYYDLCPLKVFHPHHAHSSWHDNAQPFSNQIFIAVVASSYICTENYSSISESQLSLAQIHH